VVGERSGIVNLGLEGVLLVSAASGVAVASLTGNPYLGILAAMLAGGLMNLMFGYLVITRKANQLASGLSMMFFGFGLSALIGRDFVGVKITALPKLLLPGLSSLPRLYTSLFKFDFLILLVIPMAFLIWWLLFRTRWGLVLRAVGENADIAFASGRNPLWIRYQALFLRDPGSMGAAHLATPHHELDPIYDRRDRFIVVLVISRNGIHRAIAGVLIHGSCLPAITASERSTGISFLLNSSVCVNHNVLIAWAVPQAMRRQPWPRLSRY
jgi:simple sugar transport system permease protein